MSCQEMRELFSARIDDALGAGERARLDAHLATCAECAREWQRFQATVGLLRAVEPVRAPAGFVDRVLAAAQPVPWYRRLARGLLVPWTVKLPVEAAALLLLGGLAVLIFQRSPDLQQAAYAPTMQNEALKDAPAQHELSATHNVRAYEPPPATALPPPAAATGSKPAVTPPDLAVKGPAPERKAEAQGARGLAQGVEESVVPRDDRQEQTLDRAAGGEMQRFARPPEKFDQLSRSEGGAKMVEEPLAAGKRQRASQAAPPAAPSVAAPPVIAQGGAAPSGMERVMKERADAAAKAAPEESRVGALNLARSQLAARFAGPAVDARLTVTDLVAAEREVIALLERLGAEVVREGDVFELTVSRDGFAELLPALARLGDLKTERRPAELPPRIRVILRLGS